MLQKVTPNTSVSIDVSLWPLASGGDGTKTVAVQYRDVAGNWSGDYTDDIILDQTPPVITITTPTNGANYTLNSVVNALWSATDALSGIKSKSGTVASGSPIDTSSIGTKDFQVDAEDNAGNTATLSVNYGVIYQWYGFLPPINTSGTMSVFKLGSTVPVKFRIGPGIIGDDATATITYALVKPGGPGTVNEAVSTSAATSGNLFRYDSTDNLYIFNLNTKKITDGAGTYRISVTLDDGMTYNVDIGLK